MSDKHRIYQNVWDTDKVVLGGKYTALNTLEEIKVFKSII